MPRHTGAGRLAWIAVVLVALLGGAGYTAYAGGSLYLHLRGGGDGLVSAQAKLSTGLRSGQAEAIRSAQSDLNEAGHDFAAAYGSARDDPAFRLLGGLPATGDQVEASRHLAAMRISPMRGRRSPRSVSRSSTSNRPTPAGR